jgi:hypothetical protein
MARLFPVARATIRAAAVPAEKTRNEAEFLAFDVAR